MKEGDRVQWEGYNGPCTGTVLGPSPWPGYVEIKTESGRHITAASTCLKKIEE